MRYLLTMRPQNVAPSTLNALRKLQLAALTSLLDIAVNGEWCADLLLRRLDLVTAPRLGWPSMSAEP